MHFSGSDSNTSSCCSVGGANWLFALKPWAPLLCPPVNRLWKQRVMTTGCEQRITVSVDFHIPRCLWCILYASENRLACSAQVKSLPCFMAFCPMLFILFWLCTYAMNWLFFFSFVFGSSPCFRGGSSLWLTLLKTSNKTIVKTMRPRCSSCYFNSISSVVKKTRGKAKKEVVSWWGGCLEL